MHPNILFAGYGRAGKDEAAQYLAWITKLRYAGSFSWAALPHMAQHLGMHPQQAWETRHHHRALWKTELDRLREHDQCYLARLVLKQGELAAGIRDKAEVDAVKREGLFDHIIWVHRPGIPVDPTVTFSPEDCNGEISNGGDLFEFHAKLKRLAGLLNLPARGVVT